MAKKLLGLVHVIPCISEVSLPGQEYQQTNGVVKT